MQKSDSIAELANALASAQSEIKGAVKDSENPFFKSKYADLASVWDACRAALTKNRIAVIQTPRSEVKENCIIIAVGTLLMHSSGEWVSEELSAVPVKDDPQGIGSCITYLRRYALSAFTGVAPEDDDGNAASGPTRQTVTRGRSGGQSDTEKEKLIGAIKEAAGILNGLGDTPPWTGKKLNNFANDNFNIKSGLSGLTVPQLNDYAKLLSMKIDELKTPSDKERENLIASIRGNFKDEKEFEGYLANKVGLSLPAFESLSLDRLKLVENETSIPF